MGIEPILLQRPSFAGAKISEVTAMLPVLENPQQTSEPSEKLLVAG